ncbi:MAG: hypothetical protein IV107_09715 [Paucibacter sp.]|nr:hypothetical protein [Roseateles sp.]
MSKPPSSAARSAKTASAALTAIALGLGGCASSGKVGSWGSSSHSNAEQAEIYEQRARDMQMAGAGQQTTELRRLADQHRLDAKNKQADDLAVGLIELLIKGWRGSSSKGK